MTFPAALLSLFSCLLLMSVDGRIPLLAAEAAASMPEHEISISFDLDTRTLSGTSRIQLPPGTPLQLASGPLQLSSAILEQAGRTPQPLRPSPDGRIVVAAADASQTLYTSWTLTVPEGGANDNLIGRDGITLAGFWHLLPDRALRHRLEAVLPPSFIAVSEAEKVSVEQDGKGRQRFATAFPHPVHGIHFVAGPYAIKEKTLAGGVVLATYFFPEDSDLAADYLERGAAYLERYQELIGPYPYARYSIVENRLPTGYGMPTFTLLGQAVVRLPFIKDTSLGHEILHSWFGNSVHVKEDDGNWCEGLTTYLADHLYAEDRGEGGDYRKEQLQRYAAYVPRDNDLTLAAFVNTGDGQPLARRIRAVGYDKGSMFFHMLRRRLGDEKFSTGLRRLYADMRYRQAGWEEIETSFSAAAGEDLAPFFEQWLTRTDAVKFVIGNVDVSQVDGRSAITFTVQQKSVLPYDFDLPVVVTTRSGDEQQTVRITEASQEVKVTVDSLPLSMALDPDYDLMRALRPEEEAPTWSRFLGEGKKTVVLPPPERETYYAPLLALLEELGGETVAADKVDTKSLAEGNVIFLDASPQSLGLFADPGHPASGFTLDVRRNPLAPGKVMALLTSASAEESAAVLRKLSHYGKYSFLHFQDGRIKEQKIAPTARGLRLDLFQSPEGIRVPDIRTFEEILGELRQSRVVYAGETHTDMGAHILQLQIIQALHQENPDLAIGMEMFPASSQAALDDYISGAIASEGDFLKKSGYFKVWGFDYRLYREIIGYARRHGIPLVALNLDKEVVNQVFAEGNLDTLDDQQRQQVPAERQLDLPGYRERLAQAFAGHEGRQFSGDRLAGFVQAQAIWDEAMAERIVGYLKDHPEQRMVVVAGTGHVYKDTGIPPRVARRLDVPQSVISSASYGATGLETGTRLDYLLYARPLELEPAPKLGLVLEVEGAEEDPAQGRVRVQQVSPHGKAGEGGIKEKDIIVTVEGAPVHDIMDIRIALLDKKNGDKVPVKVLREYSLLPDEELDLEVELTTPMEGMGGTMPSQHPK